MSEEPVEVHTESHVLRGVLILAAAAAVIVAVILLVRWRQSARPRVDFVAYSGVPTDLHVEDEITLESTSIGKIKQLDSIVTAVTVTVARADALLQAPLAVTVIAGAAPVAVTPALHLALDRTGVLHLELPAGPLSLTTHRTAHWTPDGPLPTGVTINGTTPAEGTIPDLPAGSAIQSGDYLIHVGDFRQRTALTVAIDTGAVTSFLKSSGRAALLPTDVMRALGAGARLDLGSGIGLTRAGIQLVLANPNANEAWNRLQRPELAVTESSDVLATLTAFVSYLGDPSSMHAEPNNRFEQAVHDLNETLTSANVAVAQAGQMVKRLSGTVGNEGWVLDATIGAAARKKLGWTVDSLSRELTNRSIGQMIGIDTVLGKITSNVKSLTDTLNRNINKLGDSVGVVVANLKHETSQDSGSLITHAKRAIDTLPSALGKGAGDGIKDGIKGGVGPIATPVAAVGFSLAGLVLAFTLRVLHIIH